ncbi:hypothetical protein EVAR_11785_1 [Eumeta japonica]|uniref:Uncharacterized protein n=1 Tax=Eumeta variegata TaxID=151549 RepID=A0A4C1UPC4_EUMVA|nr:hypothetical protein EVAR_11785_1 [Eumeta japonica]
MCVRIAAPSRPFIGTTIELRVECRLRPVPDECHTDRGRRRRCASSWPAAVRRHFVRHPRRSREPLSFGVPTISSLKDPTDDAMMSKALK